MIAEDLIAVLDQLKVNLVIGLGEGAGANILARFGMAYPDRCMGLILIHCTSTTAGVMEHFKDKVRKGEGGRQGGRNKEDKKEECRMELALLHVCLKGEVRKGGREDERGRKGKGD